LTNKPGHCAYNPQKYGRPNDKTPDTWKKDYKSFENHPDANGGVNHEQPTATAKTTPAKATEADSDEDMSEEESVKAAATPVSNGKKRKADSEDQSSGEETKKQKHEGETKEEVCSIDLYDPKNGRI
jgi:H/ACA ribonucleoprotein complex subunit 4